MTVSLICIADQDYGLGGGRSTPWSFPAYKKYFERLVAGHPVIIGRKTYQERGPVPGSVNIVVTANAELVVPEMGVLSDDDLHSAIERSKWLQGGEEVFVVGGAELFEHALVSGVLDRIYVTHIAHKKYDCDCFFQDKILKDSFKESHRILRYKDAENPERLDFVVYHKRRANQEKDKIKTQ